MGRDAKQTELDAARSDSSPYVYRCGRNEDEAEKRKDRANEIEKAVFGYSIPWP